MHILDSHLFSSAVQRYGTPLYLYDADRIRNRVNSLYSALAEHQIPFHLHYAVKANTNLQILALIKDCGLSAECASPGEVFSALKAGFLTKDIFYSSNFESSDDLQFALQHQLLINCDSFSAFERLCQFKVPERISFRINPGQGMGAFKGITTGGESAKFGVPHEEAVKLYQIAKAKGVKKFGIHCMVGSNNRDAYHPQRILELMRPIVESVFHTLDEEPLFINIGGGLGVAYAPHEANLDCSLMALALAETFKDICHKNHWVNTALMLEPGRFFVADAGVLLAKVTSVKNSYKKFVGIDAGMNTLLRPALYEAYHHITVLGKTGNEETVSICGQICENTDVFIHDYPLSKVVEGDILVIHTSGAYGMVMSSTYNNRPRPAELLRDRNQLILIRKRDTLDDLLLNQVFETLS